jgi:hypothetical protein
VSERNSGFLMEPSGDSITIAAALFAKHTASASQLCNDQAAPKALECGGACHRFGVGGADVGEIVSDPAPQPTPKRRQAAALQSSWRNDGKSTVGLVEQGEQ